MEFKKFIRKKGFWVAVSGVIVILMQLFGLQIDVPYINEALSGLCAIMVAVGLMTTVEKKEIDEELKKKTQNKDGEEAEAKEEENSENNLEQ